MFTGIVETLGAVVAVEHAGARSRLTIEAPGLTDLVHGESIAVNGVCLTVAAHEGSSWTADVMRITLETTALAGIAAGDRVNLERAMPANGRLGGHLMQGHVDGVATLVARDSQPEWDDLTFEIPAALERYVVRKGSIALNGVSLTVAELDGLRATVSLIPTTLEETTFGSFQVGDQANVEVDVIAKYVEKMMVKA
ncbi:riboflavin synthase [Demequina lignilytica]|uniref:Riboflavin synthase n=1 Tax=Demequina lignilytica TaxID=3051663 RepID=A0AAW7LZJ3_9MICO|nr:MULTISPECIES: riboflavin synthase [unclassified Demequina]MDN4482020.1 riboflavin synthase [Demequina sp. SYSU T0a273]MDN4486679.1 riboflavin synthase [Demequina sp. SYSU T00039]MDN4489365.1 riboflavin synthase [Demequina sp. SYSU T00068]